MFCSVSNMPWKDSKVQPHACTPSHPCRKCPWQIETTWRRVEMRRDGKKPGLKSTTFSWPLTTKDILTSKIQRCKALTPNFLVNWICESKHMLSRQKLRRSPHCTDLQHAPAVPLLWQMTLWVFVKLSGRTLPGIFIVICWEGSCKVAGSLIFGALFH